MPARTYLPIHGGLAGDDRTLRLRAWRAIQTVLGHYAGAHPQRGDRHPNAGAHPGLRPRPADRFLYPYSRIYRWRSRRL